MKATYAILVAKKTTIGVRADSKPSDEDIKLEPNTILYTQEKDFTLSQINELKEKGFHYQFGFGPMYDYIPLRNLKLVRIEELKV